ncbi:MAG: FMN-binding protein [Myxococcota bacterium]
MRRSARAAVCSGHAALLLGVLLGPLGPAPRAAVYASQREALEQAFPKAERIDRRSFVLSEAQVREVERLSRAPLDSPLVTLHVAFSGAEPLGYALIDVHRVRTVPEALLVVLTPDGQVRSVRLLAFHEPVEYQPKRRWYRQFEGRRLTPELQLGRDIHAIAGATLSSRAATRSVRRALALFQVLVAKAPTAREER